MRNAKRVLLLLVLVASACATAPTAHTTAHTVPTSSAAASHRATSEFHQTGQALQDAYQAIVEKESHPVAAQPVDLLAALSIPIPDHPAIRSAITLFSRSLKPSVQESLIRSGRYRKLIEKALDEYHLPPGLAYLPVIESAYIPTLTSRAGAHGIWQFMPETAREYGLRVDWWVDDRADPERSTRAAAAYLKDLYRQFNDWSLALAAYNAGPSRIRRALASTGATTFWELLEQSAVPRETRGYVPTFFATLMIASDPAAYGFRLGEPLPLEAVRVEIEGPVSLRYLAEAAQVDEATLRELNPSLRQALVPPGRSSIRIPSRAAPSITDRASTLRNDDASLKLCSFTLREDDSAESLADALGAKLDTVLAMNGRTEDDFEEGDSIFLPVRARELGSLLDRSVAQYAVKKGDTMYSIARAHGLSVSELLDLNDFSKGHTLHPGDHLRTSPGRALAAGGM